MGGIDTIMDWVFVGVIGLVVLAFLVVAACVALTFLAALWEKQYIENYTPLRPEDRLAGNPYYTVMNQLATNAGYLPCGEFYANRNGPFSRVRAALWMAPDGLTTAVVAGGKVAGIRYRKTLFFSRLRTGGSLLTIDEFSVHDLSGTRETKVVLRADFLELASAHTMRLIAVKDSVEPFARDRVVPQMNEMEAARVRRLVSLGFGRYLDPQQLTWRHSIRGAWVMTFAGFFRGIQQAEEQSERQRRSRPGG